MTREKGGARVVLDALSLRDFRNLARLDLDFPGAGAVLVGENGQGIVDTVPAPRESLRMADLAIGAAVTLVIVTAGLAIWLVPRWQLQRWRHAIKDEEKLAELALQSRASMIQAFGGLALIATLAITAYQVSETRRSSNENLRVADENLRLAQQGQVSERFSRAVEQLGTTDAQGEPAIDVRTGALFSLWRIGLDSTTDTEPAFRVVAAYIRNHYTAPDDPHHGCEAFYLAAPDIATALGFVLPALANKLLADALLGDPQVRKLRRMRGLKGAKLRGLALDQLVLTGFDLKGIKFRYAHLGKLDVHGSNLRSAHFARACLPNANFRGADVRGADFSGACLDRADFQDALVSVSTNFNSAHVAGAKFDPGILENTFPKRLNAIDVCP